jgi:nucleoside-diphosphate-sugar epimerase
MANQKILVTGMSGQIGGIIRSHLGDTYELSGIDIKETADAKVHVADISDLDAIQPAFEGIDTVIHLGADPSPRASWESILQNNLIGTRNVFEAARLAGVRRVIFASSNHVVGYFPLKEDPYKAIYEGRLEDVRKPFPMLDGRALRPDSYYGVSKAFGESLGSYFHDAYDISVICMRIGWVMTPDDPTFHPAALSLWLSHRDAAGLIEKCIEAPESVGFAIVHGMSNNRLRIWESETTRDIVGFVPHDGAGQEWTERPDGPSFI